MKGICPKCEKEIMPIERLWAMAQLPEGRHDWEPYVVVWCPFCGKQLRIVMTLEAVSSNAPHQARAVASRPECGCSATDGGK